MNTELNIDYDRAVLLNRRISANVRAAQESLFEVCKDLKEIRDGKLYMSLGYNAFDDYCIKEHELSYKQACKYIAVAERFPDGISPGRLGISKLYLISTLSDEEKSEIEHRVDVEEISKSQLEKAISDLKAENKRLEEEKQVTFDELEKLRNENSDVSQAKERIEFLQVKLEEQEKLTQKESKQREDAAHRASIAETDRDELRTKVSQLESKIRTLEAREPETVTVTDTTEINRLKSELTETKKKLAEKTETEVVTETIEIKDDIDEFRAHFANALDSVARLISFVKQHEESKNFELFDKKLKALADKLNGGTE